MLQESINLKTFLSAQSVLTDVVGSKIFPIVGKEKNDFPFATYRVEEEAGQSKDGDQVSFTLALWFGVDDYDDCVALTDALKLLIKDSVDYDWLSSTIEFIQENQSFVGIINFNT